MCNLSLYTGNPRELSPTTLAFIGDGVFELMVRERLLGKGSMPARKLHNLAVEKVKAVAQAKAFAALEAELSDEERGILMRGRNANVKTPKSAPPDDYRKATAIEALFGYLYLKGDIERLSELFTVVDEVLNESA